MFGCTTRVSYGDSTTAATAKWGPVGHISTVLLLSNGRCTSKSTTNVSFNSNVIVGKSKWKNVRISFTQNQDIFVSIEVSRKFQGARNFFN